MSRKDPNAKATDMLDPQMQQTDRQKQDATFGKLDQHGHGGKVEESGNHGFWKAVCGCGWRSAELGDKTLAEASLERHRQFPDEPWVKEGQQNPGSNQTVNNTVPLVPNRATDAPPNPDQAPMPRKNDSQQKQP